MNSPRSVGHFLSRCGERADITERFDTESERMLRIDVDGDVWLKPGAAIAYRGDLTFSRRSTLAAETLTDAAFRELTPLVRATGQGRLFCGHQGLIVRVIRLAGETIVVSWQDLLAFEASLEFEMSLVAHGLTVAAGGLIVVKLSGHGALAMATQGEPLVLAVEAGQPVSTDPHATLAWSGTLTPTLKTDLDWRSLFWHGGQQDFQMLFDGDGFVIVQPHKDASRMSASVKTLRGVTTLFAAL